MQIQHRILSTLIIFTITWSVLSAKSLDLIGINATTANQILDPIAQIIASEQTPPLTMLSFKENPNIAAGISSPTLALPEYQSLSSGFPAFWFLVSVTPNLTIGANIAGYDWRGDNIQTVGPFLNTSWGTYQKSVSASFHFHQFKGPDHFHLNDVAFGLSRIVHYRKWSVGYGISGHYLRTYIHVTDQTDLSQNYEAIKKLKYYFLRYGLYRHIGKNIELGNELFLSTKIQMTKLLFTYNL